MKHIVWITDIHLNLYHGSINMPSYPDRDAIVLCGHTHDAGKTRVLSNLHVLTGGAEYGRPCLQDMLVVR